MKDQLLTIIVSVISGGGCVAIVQAIAGRNRNKSEVTEINVKTAIKLQEVAMERYNDAISNYNDAIRNLEAANQYLAEVRRELDVYRNYINVLEDLLIKNRVELPERPRL